MLVPKEIGELEVIISALIDESCVHTKYCSHKFDGKILGKAKWAAITNTGENGSCYLFMCYGNNELSDTFHESIEEAKDQAEWEYEGISKNWKNAT